MNMDQIMELLTKIGVPVGIIGVVGIVIFAIYKVAKICTSNTANTIRIAIQNKKISELENKVESSIDERIADYECEKSYLQKLNEITFNKKQVELNNKQINYYDGKISALKEEKVRIATEKEANKEAESKKKKVRVKVVKKAVEETKGE